MLHKYADLVWQAKIPDLVEKVALYAIALKTNTQNNIASVSMAEIAAGISRTVRTARKTVKIWEDRKIVQRYKSANPKTGEQGYNQYELHIEALLEQFPQQDLNKLLRASKSLAPKSYLDSTNGAVGNHASDRAVGNHDFLPGGAVGNHASDRRSEIMTSDPSDYYLEEEEEKNSSSSEKSKTNGHCSKFPKSVIRKYLAWKQKNFKVRVFDPLALTYTLWKDGSEDTWIEAWKTDPELAKHEIGGTDSDAPQVTSDAPPVDDFDARVEAELTAMPIEEAARMREEIVEEVRAKVGDKYDWLWDEETRRSTVNARMRSKVAEQLDANKAA